MASGDQERGCRLNTCTHRVVRGSADCTHPLRPCRIVPPLPVSEPVNPIPPSLPPRLELPSVLSSVGCSDVGRSHGPVGTLKSHPNAVSVACSGAKLDEAIKRLDETLRGLCAEGPVRLAPSREELLKRASSNSVVTLGFGAEGLGIDLNAGDDIACSPLLEAFKARLAARLEMEARSPPRLCQVRGGYELRTVRANCVIRIEVDASLMLLYRSPSPNSEVVGVPVLQRDEVVMMIKSTWPTRVRADDIAIHMLEDGGATMHAGIDPRLGLILIQLNRKRDPELVALGISSVAPHTHSNAMLEAARGNQLSAKDEAVERISKLMFKFDMAPRFIGKS